MGLDITAYRQLKKLDAVFNADGEPIDPTTREPLDWQTYVEIGPNEECFSDRAVDLEVPGSVCSFAEKFGFHAGSYSGYNAWRSKLAKLAGYTDCDAFEGRVQPPWPFVELVNFTDCDGVIGTAVSAKLAADFAAFDDRAKAMPDEHDGFYSRYGWFYSRYSDWRKAFEMAADGGCVDFH